MDKFWLYCVIVHFINSFNISCCFSESMTVVLSTFYAKLLIVLGLALPVTSTIQNEIYTNIASDVSFVTKLYSNFE